MATEAGAGAGPSDKASLARVTHQQEQRAVLQLQQLVSAPEATNAQAQALPEGMKGLGRPMTAEDVQQDVEDAGGVAAEDDGEEAEHGKDQEALSPKKLDKQASKQATMTPGRRETRKSKQVGKYMQRMFVACPGRLEYNVIPSVLTSAGWCHRGWC